jgi:hypothetical protein
MAARLLVFDFIRFDEERVNIVIYCFYEQRRLRTWVKIRPFLVVLVSFFFESKRGLIPCEIHAAGTSPFFYAYFQPALQVS